MSVVPPGETGVGAGWSLCRRDRATLYAEGLVFEPFLTCSGVRPDRLIMSQVNRMRD